MSRSRRFLREELGALEAVMPAAAKDLSKGPYSTKLLLKNTSVSRVHVITDSISDTVELEGVTYHDESDVLPYGSDFFPYRPKWLFQQMLKLTQDVTRGDWYVSVDADAFVVSPIQLYGNSGPFLFHEVDSGTVNAAYAEFNKKMFGASNYPFFALNNVVLFNKPIIRDIMSYVGAGDQAQFAEEVRTRLTRRCFPAEAQLYLSWIIDNAPGLYEFKKLRIGWRGMYDGYVFSDRQIEDTIRKYSGGVDLLLLHSWELMPAGYSGGEYNA